MTAELDGKTAYNALQTAVHRIRTEMPDLDVDGQMVVDKPAQALLNLSAGATLIVVGHQRRGRVDRLALGSVASAVVSHSAGDVVVVPGEAEVVERQIGPVVVGVDGSEGSEAAVEFAIQASLHHGQQLVVMHIGDEKYADVMAKAVTVGAPAPASDLGALSPALRTGRSEYPAVLVDSVIETGKPAESLVAASSNAVLLVVGSRGLGGVKVMLLGSVSRAVLEMAQCPVAVVRTPVSEK